MSACSSEPDRRFTELSPDETNIHFLNRVENTPEFNIQNYLYFYDGGGVAAGDINKDGLPDLFFVANNGEHKLYLNKGNFEFEDITEISGLEGEPGSWSTGAAMADVNGNGFLDIYISRVNYLNKSGANQLFINNGDSTFTDRAEEYGLDFEGYSTQAAFFDYNGSGRLDLFLLNHSFHNENTYGRAELLRSQPDPEAGDRLYRNDGDRFTDVTSEAGIISSALGYGLGLAVTDINMDGFPDIYVGNDFHEDDYFYINNGDGSFTESLYSMVGHTSNSSMGNDIADINNDGRPDIVSLDMMPMDQEGFLKSGGPDLMIVKEAKLNFGFGEKNNRNTLQVNRGFPTPDSKLPVFSETAFASGIAKTDWSWASLFADYDNDGLNDLFITNGIPKRPNDLDYVSALQRVREQHTGEELNDQRYALIEMMPEVHVPNQMFRNNGDLTFADSTETWGFSKPLYSSGAVYADLDNNGLLDLVVNNTNETASVYKNDPLSENSGSYLKVKLNGSQHNSSGIGTKVFLFSGDERFYREQFPTRGFQSSVDHVLHFGLGTRSEIDSLLVVWPGGAYEVVPDPQLNNTLEMEISDAKDNFDYSRLKNNHTGALLRDVTDDVDLDYIHRENSFDDFYREPLVPYKLSRRGPAMAAGDVTGNGLDDIFLGGSRGNPGVLYLQQSSGTFIRSDQRVFEEDRETEDVDAIFFDATGNGSLDLYVVSGGYEYPTDSPFLQDRLYINRGDNLFERSQQAIPDHRVNSAVVRAADFDADGSMDLFVGGYADPWKYGIGPRSVLLRNDGSGNYSDVTREMAPELVTLGNVTSAEWIMNPQGDLPDLVVAGEWMPVHYFLNMGGTFESATQEFGFDKLKGLWQSVEVSDLNGDGKPDIIAGNFGINSRMQPDEQNPVRLYINDFDDNGQTEPLISVSANAVEKPFEQLDELRAQISNIENRAKSYSEFAGKPLTELFDSELLNEALRKDITTLHSLVLLSNGDGGYDIHRLPVEAQWFPVMAIHVQDVDGDELSDLILGGNIFDLKPGFGGRQDAGFGLVLKGDGTGNFTPLSIRESGMFAGGEVRAITDLIMPQSETAFFVVRNDDSPLFFKLNQP